MDYPQHLAKLQIRKTIGFDTNVSQFYQFGWKFTPHLGVDLLATPFLPFLPVEVTGRIVIVVTFVLICMGTILLDRELNRENYGLSLFSGIFLYNGAFMWGFLQYLIGIGFSIWLFWCWVRYREKVNGIGIVLFTVLGGVVCMMNLWALVTYGVCVAGYECAMFWENLRTERQVRLSQLKIPCGAAISLLIPLLAFIIPASPVTSNYAKTVWGLGDSLVKWKAEVLVSPIFTRQLSFEKPLLVAVTAIFVVGLATRTIAVNPRMLIPLGAFGVILIIIPTELVGWWFAEHHLASGMVFYALAGIGWGNTSRARIQLVCLLLAVCLLVRIGSVIWSWQPMQAIIDEYDSALQLVPPGSRMLVLIGSDYGGPLFHVPVLAAAKQSVFVPYTWTQDNEFGFKGIALLRVMPDYRDYLADLPTDTRSINDLGKFDYLLEVEDPQVTISADFSLLEVKRGQTFRLYKVQQVPR
jgi:hypothetical protein